MARFSALGACGAAAVALAGLTAHAAEPLRVGVIGLDTSHSIAFTKLLNVVDAADHVPGARVVVASPRGSVDIPSSVSRVPEYTEAIKGLGVEIVDSVAAVVPRVDVVLLESNDGRVHLEQALPVLQAGKRLFIDKPVAGSLVDTIAIFRLAEHYKVPVFTASALRFAAGTVAVREGSLGEVVGCDTYSPCEIEKTHPDLFWYGIHGCESLYTVMGTGCESVARVHTADADVVTGIWSGGRVGTFRGLRTAAGFGGTAFGKKGLAPVGAFDGYRPLVAAIVTFFETGVPPVTAAETIELFAFMEAADESRRRDGARVSVADVLRSAKAEADRKVAAVLGGR